MQFCVDANRFSVKWRMNSSHDELLHAVRHASSCQHLPAGNNEEPSQPSVLNFIPTPTCRTVHRRHPTIVYVRHIWSLNERRADDSNLLSMAANLRPTNHLPASGMRMLLNHVSNKRTEAFEDETLRFVSQLESRSDCCYLETAGTCYCLIKQQTAEWENVTWVVFVTEHCV